MEQHSYLPPEEPLFQPSNLAAVSLVMGFLGWIALPLLAGIAAVALGHMARLEIARSEGRLTGDWMAVTGLVLGYTNIAFVAIAVICIASFFLVPAIRNYFPQ